MQFIFRLIQLLLIGASVALLLPSLALKNHFTVLFLIAAIVVILPFTEPFLETKVPFLKSAIARIGLWSGLIFLAMVSSLLNSVSEEIPSSSNHQPAEISPLISNLVVCIKPQQNRCTSDIPALVRNDPKLYFSADFPKIPNDSVINVALKYTPEPEKQQDLGSRPLKASVQGERILLTMDTQDLPVGTYEATLRLQKDARELGKKEFTVWDTEQDLKLRQSNELKPSDVKIQEITLCDEMPTRLGCKDGDSFSRGIEALFLQVYTGSTKEKTTFRVRWKRKNQTGNYTVVAENNDVPAGANYRLINQGDTQSALIEGKDLDQSLGSGEWELIVALNTKNAKPVYRKFTLK